MIDEDTFSICIWALLYATILAPFVFTYVLARHIEAENLEITDESGEAVPDSLVDARHDMPQLANDPADMDPAMFGKPELDPEASVVPGDPAAKKAVVKPKKRSGAMDAICCLFFGHR